MSARLVRTVPFAIAIILLASAVVLWTSSATFAGASASFDSGLKPVSGSAVKIAYPNVAPYTVSPAVKVAQMISRNKTNTKAAKVAKRPTATVAAASTGGGELATAKRLLAAQIAKHPILKGTTIEFGDARGYQAISYYRSGRIIVSSKHTSSLSAIVAHEVWHIIDWRDNGRIDWGENIPPR